MRDSEGEKNSERETVSELNREIVSYTVRDRQTVRETDRRRH